jgi:hypothetical protein
MEVLHFISTNSRWEQQVARKCWEYELQQFAFFVAGLGEHSETHGWLGTGDGWCGVRGFSGRVGYVQWSLVQEWQIVTCTVMILLETSQVSNG